MAKLRLCATFLLLTAAALAGCSTPEAEDGSASVYVKDAPTDDFAEIHVVFTEVRVHAAGGDDEDEEEDDEDEPGDVDLEDGNETAENETDEEEDDGAGWRTLFQSSEGVDVDLLNASGSQAAFLGEADLPAGQYTQIRVIVTEAYGVDPNGNRVDFEVSSGTLRLVQPFNVEEGMESRIVLDFDLDRAIHELGNGEWRMTPVVGRTDVEFVEDAESGEDAAEEGEVVEVEE